MVKSFLIAGFRGFLGSGVRFLISCYIQASFTSAFPCGTFIVNILGSLLIKRNTILILQLLCLPFVN